MRALGEKLRARQFFFLWPREVGTYRIEKGSVSSVSVPVPSFSPAGVGVLNKSSKPESQHRNYKTVGSTSTQFRSLLAKISLT